MIEKKLTLIITFETTTQAMAMESACRSGGIPGRIIPLPEEISAGCGLSWSVPPEYRELILNYAEEQNLVYDQCCEIYF